MSKFHNFLTPSSEFEVGKVTEGVPTAITKRRGFAPIISLRLNTARAAAPATGEKFGFNATAQRHSGSCDPQLKISLSLMQTGFS
jgi:hypothetical protein